MDTCPDCGRVMTLLSDGKFACDYCNATWAPGYENTKDLPESVEYMCKSCGAVFVTTKGTDIAPCLRCRKMVKVNP